MQALKLNLGFDGIAGDPVQAFWDHFLTEADTRSVHACSRHLGRRGLPRRVKGVLKSNPFLWSRFRVVSQNLRGTVSFVEESRGEKGAI